LLVHRDKLVRLFRAASFRPKIPFKDPLSDAGDRKMPDAAAHVSTDVAVLEPPHEDRIESGSGDDAELAR
jgi:hypothetical protein